MGPREGRLFSAAAVVAAVVLAAAVVAAAVSAVAEAAAGTQQNENNDDPETGVISAHSLKPFLRTNDFSLPGIRCAGQ